MFKYDAASDTFTAGTLGDQPPNAGSRAVPWRSRPETTFLSATGTGALRAPVNYIVSIAAGRGTTRSSARERRGSRLTSPDVVSA